MIIVQLQGGLGNQMFQYAAGRRLAKLRDTKLMLDTSWYDRAKQDDGVGKRVYELGPMAISEHLWRPTVAAKAQLKLHHGPIFNDEDNSYVYHTAFDQLPNYTRLFGYFQNEKYFRDIRDVIMREFTLKQSATGRNAKLLAAIEADDSSVSLHVRRGDYVTSAAHSAHHGAKGPDYYAAATKRLATKVKNPTYYVFSDDIAWCRQHIKLDDKTVFVDGNDYGGEDMRLMRACRHNIIANSSFSWWGAWLNPNPDKIVIAPRQWLQTRDVDTSDIVPSDWIKL